ncbi:MAG: hypothetical protein DMG11_18620 [Acidobacteria bacterium]|nr:MAG: hypothetical protein DMG11_18620 [Acidobacteriota bacterium]
MDRKYGQRGYQDNDRDRERRDPEKPRQQPKGGPRGSKAKEGPRLMKMPGFQEVLRCALCGAIVPLPVQIKYESQCPKCKADLRSCKNCRHFDTAAQFECTQPIPERITKKDLRNKCEFFMARASIERETRDSGGNNSSGVTTKPSDARSAFDNLFKK